MSTEIALYDETLQTIQTSRTVIRVPKVIGSLRKSEYKLDRIEEWAKSGKVIESHVSLAQFE